MTGQVATTIIVAQTNAPRNGASTHSEPAISPAQRPNLSK